MLRMRNGTRGLSGKNGERGESDSGERAKGWEMTPGGMLVQKRDPEADRNIAPPPTVRLRVKYGSVCHEIHISSQATFGELKKKLSGPTGLHHEDQKLLFKDKERDSKTFLDTVGVKDKSKLVLVEDPISKEKRYLEMQRNAKMERAAKSISRISLEVDRLAGKVSALESVISRGAKVAEKDIVNLIELLMNQLLLLDRIVVDGEVKLQRKMQVRRVQKCVETLDLLKIKNSSPGNTENHNPSPSIHLQQKHSNGQRSISISTPRNPPRLLTELSGHCHEEPSGRSTSGPVVVTTKWETFDSVPLVPVTSGSDQVPPKFNWELF